MKFFRKIELNKRSVIFLLIFLITVFIISGYFEYKARQNEVLDLMNRMTKNIISTVKKAAVNSILSYDYINTVSRENMESLLKYLSDLSNAKGEPGEELIQDLIKDTDLERIAIYDKRGNTKYLSHQEKWISDEQVTGFLQSQDSISAINSNGKLILMLKDNKGGLILGLFNTQGLHKFHKNLGIGKFINDVAADSSIIYIAIQDVEGIIAGSKKLDSLSAIGFDSFLTGAYVKKDFNSRVTKYRSQKVYESVMPFYILDTYYGIIRIGLSYEPLQNVKAAAIRNVFIRLIILTIVGFIVISYAMSRNTIASLKNEKERITQEVYELQKSLREKEKQNAIHQLAAGIAHEIGNPLNALSLNVQRLHRNLSSDDKKNKKMLTLIKNEVKRIDKIIKQFLNFSKPLPLEKKKLDLTNLIDEVAEIYAEKFKNHKIALSWSSNGQLPIEADREKLKQAFINLFENAIDAMNSGGEIKISTRKNKESIEVQVSDTGPGIDPEQQSKIFNLFYTTKDNGTGIGLSEVYKIIQNHGGEIKVRSQQQEGTTFLIQLPRK